MKRNPSKERTANLAGIRKFRGWLLSPVSGWNWRAYRSSLIAVCMFVSAVSAAARWPQYMLLEKSWRQPAVSFGSDLAIATVIAAAIALSPSMKNFHPLKLGGIWLVAASLGGHFGVLGPAGVLSTASTTMAIWLTRDL